MLPDWLPAPLIFRGTNVLHDYEALHAVYVRDFVANRNLSIDGGAVIVDTSTDPHNPNYTRGFTHLVTRGDNARAIDYERAAKLPWIRCVIENYTQPEVQAFWHSSPKGRQLYLWMPDYDFVVILRPLKSSKEHGNKIIVTAFSVDTGKRYQLQKRFGDATRILQ